MSRLMSRFLTPMLAMAIAAAAFATAAPALAGTEAPYSPAAFAAAQAAGRPVVLHVTATWCPVCAKQHPIVAKLLADPAFADLQVLDVDFDTQKDLLRSLGVQRQSTLVAFHGTAERGRTTGDTDEAAIRALLAKAAG